MVVSPYLTPHCAAATYKKPNIEYLKLIGREIFGCFTKLYNLSFWPINSYTQDKIFFIVSFQDFNAQNNPDVSTMRYGQYGHRWMTFQMFFFNQETYLGMR